MDSKVNYQCLKRISVVDSVKEWIVSQLVNGTIKPGDKIPTESELSEYLGVGRNSIREAIKQLEAQGIVRIKRAEGTYISDNYDPNMFTPLLYGLILQDNNWKDFISFRKALDIGILYIIVEKDLNKKKIEELEALFKEFEQTISSGNVKADIIMEIDCRFHDVIADMTDNPQLITICEFVNRITLPSRLMTTEKVISDGKIEGYIDLHRQLINTIVNREKSNIEKVVADHYVYWENK